MNIFIKTLNGETFELEVEPSDTVLQVKEQILEKKNIPTEQQRLLHAAQSLEDSKTLGDYNVLPGSKLDLVIRLR
jgi:ubiquitin